MLLTLSFTIACICLLHAIRDYVSKLKVHLYRLIEPRGSSLMHPTESPQPTRIPIVLQLLLPSRRTAPNERVEPGTVLAMAVAPHR